MELVNQGVWSMYTLTNDAAYILATNHDELYLVDEFDAGSEIKDGRTLRDFQLGEVVRFEGLPERSWVLKLRYG